MVHRVTTSENEWYNELQQMATSDKNDNEWYSEWQRVATNGTTCKNKRQQMKMSGTTSDSDWKRVVQRVTTKVSKSEQVKESEFRFQNETKA